jgi:hypothetical protein
MLLKNYLSELQKLIANDPSLLELKLYVAADDEGNSYQQLGYTPSIRYTKDLDYTVDNLTTLENLDEEIRDDKCIHEEDYESKPEYEKDMQNARMEYSRVVLMN